MALMTITQFMTGIKNWVMGKIENITALIPSQASSSNKLADKAFVNSSIATATATFRGSYNVVSDLSLSYNATHAQIQTALATKMSALSITPDNNDYVFVQIPTADATPTQIAKIEKYKYNGTAWAFEYELNNSGFTAAQWAAINSGATLELIGKLQALPTNAQLIALLENKVSWTDNGAYDVTAHNSGATFASLSALLNTENIDTLIPTDIRRGGMSIKFVCSYDNKYVQYRLMSITFSTTESDWQGVDTEPTGESHNLIESGGVFGEIYNLEVDIFKITELISGYYIYYANGMLDANSNYGVTPLIKVKEGDIFKFDGWTNQNMCEIAAYDANGEYIQSASQAGTSVDYGTEITFIVGANVSFVRFCSRAAEGRFKYVYKKNSIYDQINKIEENIDAETARAEAAEDSINEKLDNIISTSAFVPTYSTSGTDKYRRSSDNAIVTLLYYCVSDTFILEKGKTLVFTPANANYYSSLYVIFAEVDNSGKVIKQIALGSNEAEEYKYTAEKDTQIQVCCKITDLTNIVIITDKVTDSKVAVNDIYNARTNIQLLMHLSNPFVPTRIKLIGDSITAGVGGTGFSATGEQIGTSANNANVTTATCWANSLRDYIISNYNKDTKVNVENAGISYVGKTSIWGNTISGKTYITMRLWGNDNISSANFTFDGTHFSVAYLKNNTEGKFNIYVDGVLNQTVDAYAATLSPNNVVEITGLVATKHTVKIETTNEKNADSSNYFLHLQYLVIPKIADVKNWGVGGTTTMESDHWITQQYVTNQDDFVIIQYGTNDRVVQYYNADKTRIDLEYLVDLIRKNTNAEVVLMVANPISSEQEANAFYHMWDVKIAVELAARNCHCLYINNYDGYIEYLYNHTSVSLDDLLADGLHPNDDGYEVMLNNIMKGLGLPKIISV